MKIENKLDIENLIKYNVGYVLDQIFNVGWKAIDKDWVLHVPDTVLEMIQHYIKEGVKARAVLKIKED